MLRSMTGYGRKEASSGNQFLIIEVRSVNNRFLDVQIKAPRSFAALEPRVRKLVQDRCSRGRFDIFISRNAGERESAGRIVVDRTLLGQYVAALKEIKESYSLAGDIGLSLAAGFPGLISVTEEKEDLEAIWTALSLGLGDALNQLDRMRIEEAAALVNDMTARLERIELLMKSVEAIAPVVVEQARKRMSESITQLLNEQPDPVRVAQEIAILAERTDVTEELTRLNSHLAQFRSMTSGSVNEPVGRKLDFLLQEMGRETNTIASKAMNSQIAYHVVDIKAELEKIREQVQNLE